ncbi:MAG: oligosaccharide flippase family protein [Acidimicrobiales bacterium]
MERADDEEPRPGGLEVPDSTPNLLPGSTVSGLVVSGVGRNTLWQYANLLASSVAGLFLLAFSLRRLGTAAYGLFALAFVAIGILGMVDFGLRLSVVRAAARDNDTFPAAQRAQARNDIEAAHFAYGSFGVAAAVASAAVGLVVYITSQGLPARENLPATIVLIGLSVGLSLGTSVYPGILIGRRQFRVPAVGGLLGSAVEVVIVVTTIDRLRLLALGLGFLAGVVVSQCYPAWWLRRHERWFRLVPRVHRWSAVRRIAAFAAPLLVLSIAGQVIAATDLLVVGAVATASAVGLYKAGNTVPNQAISLLFTGFDTTYPNLAGSSDAIGQERAVRFLTRITCFVGGAMFATLVLLRTDVVRVVLGRPSPLAEAVLIVFCGVWLANIPAHGLSLLLVARHRQRVLVPLVAAEATANVALTVPLTLWMGPIGAAVATLVTIVVSNLIVLPYLVRHDLTDPTIWGSTVAAVATMALGALSAAVAVAPLFVLASGWTRLAAGLVAGGAFSCALGLIFLKPEGRSTLTAMLRRPVGT